MEENNLMEEKRKRIIQGVLVAIFACIALVTLIYPQLGVAAHPVNKTMPTKLMLDDPDAKHSDFAGDKGKTPFDHDQHVAKDSCVTCHHTNTKNLTKAIEEEVRKCTECHKAEDGNTELEGTNEDQKFKGKSAINSKDAYHGTGTDNKNQALAGCITCHKVRNIPPLGCNDCHNG